MAAAVLAAGAVRTMAAQQNFIPEGQEPSNIGEDREIPGAAEENAPAVSISYDHKQAVSGKYFNRSRTAVLILEDEEGIDCGAGELNLRVKGRADGENLRVAFRFDAEEVENPAITQADTGERTPVFGQGIQINREKAEEGYLTVIIPCTADAEYTIESIKAADTAGHTEQIRYQPDQSSGGEGNLRVEEGTEAPLNFVIDTAPPRGKIALSWGENCWESFTENITFRLFSKKSTETAAIAAGDIGSGLQGIQYIITERIYSSIEELKLETGQPGFVWTGELLCPEGRMEAEIQSDPIRREGRYVIYAKLRDYAGNETYLSSDGFLLDQKLPEIKVSKLKEPSGGIYSSDAEISAEISDPDISSGLKDIYYEIIDDNAGTADTYFILKDGQKAENINAGTDSLDILRGSAGSGEGGEPVTGIKTVIEVPGSKYSSNALRVVLHAEDYAGNEKEETEKLAIDTEKPGIYLQYGGPAANNGKYFAGARQADIVFRERNLDLGASGIEIQAAEDEEKINWACSLEQLREGKQEENGFIKILHYIDSGENTEQAKLTDDRTVTVRILFERDAEYKITDLYCKDQAGYWLGKEDWTEGKAAQPGKITVREGSEAAEEFVIDTTAPVILPVRYDNNEAENGSCFRAPRTAQFVIREKNFMPDDCRTLTGSMDEGPKLTVTEEDINGNVICTGENFDGVDWTQVSGKPCQYQGSITFKGDARYVYSLNYTDLAGNPAEPLTDSFTVDCGKPSGEIEVTVRPGIWSGFLERITFDLFSFKEETVSVRAADEISGIQTIQYVVTDGGLTEKQLTQKDRKGEILWKTAAYESGHSSGETGETLSPNKRCVIYAKLTDYAGNETYLSSDGFLLDNETPKIKIEILNSGDSDESGIFSRDVQLQITAREPDAGAAASGLEKVWYTVQAEENVRSQETVTLTENFGGRMEGAWNITVPAEIYNSNHVTVRAFARDRAGNEYKSDPVNLRIDVTAPVVTVAWNIEDLTGGRYCSQTRTAEVTVRDRNFDPDRVQFSISGPEGVSARMGSWSVSKEMGILDSASAVCRISFPEDGDYTFAVNCRDLAGNEGSSRGAETFTVDKTDPVITVTYDNNDARHGFYYKEPRTAKVTVREHNFDAAGVRAEIRALLQEQNGEVPKLSGFFGQGDIHTAFITYEADGEYTFDIECADLAGNTAKDYKKDSFTLDLTEPEVNIFNIEDQSANKDTVAPGVECRDENFDEKGVSLLLEGVNHGRVTAESRVSAVENGRRIQYDDFARTEEMDDLYTLTVRAEDLAGNTAEKTVEFSVNRYGSVFVPDRNSCEWLSGKTGNTDMPIKKGRSGSWRSMWTRSGNT